MTSQARCEDTQQGCVGLGSGCVEKALLRQQLIAWKWFDVYFRLHFALLKTFPWYKGRAGTR